MRFGLAMMLLVAAALPASGQIVPTLTPRVPYWHLWTGADGRSHLTKCLMTDFQRQSLNKQWQRKEAARADILFAYDPKGDWHEDPKVQWVVPMRGAFYIQAQDGSEVTLAPGELLLGEDLNTAPDAQGHRGHISASKGKDDIALMIVQLDAAPSIDRPCHAK